MKLNAQLKQRIIHAVCYEFILLLIGTPILSLFLKESLTHTGILWVMMSVTALVWNMGFNHFFEKMEAGFGWLQRTLPIRILHAVLFEGGLLIFTVPMIAWMLDMSLWQAFLLDLAMALSIMVYTFIYQWCYDLIQARYLSTSKKSLSKSALTSE